MSGQAGQPAAVRAASIAGPLGFALSVVAAVHLAGAGRPVLAAAGAVAAFAALVLMAWAFRRRALDGRARLPTPEQARLRFQSLNGVWVTAFVLSLVFAAPAARDVEPAAFSLALTAAPLVFLAILVSEFVRMIVRSDERERRQHLTACAIAGGALVVLAALWSVLQVSAPGLAALPGWVLLPGFAVLYALALTALQGARS